jgi:hypothetical protein
MITQNSLAAAINQQGNGLFQFCPVPGNVTRAKDCVDSFALKDRQCLRHRVWSCVDITDQADFYGH